MRVKETILYSLILSSYAFYVAGYIVLDIWLWRIFHDFGDRHRPGDKKYGTAAFSLFLCWAVLYAKYLYNALRFSPPKAKSLKPKQRSRCSIGPRYSNYFISAIICLITIANIVLLVRFCQWLPYFRTNKESKNVSYCIACIFATASGMFWRALNKSLELCGIISSGGWLAVAQEIRKKWSNKDAEWDVENQKVLRLLQ